MVVQNHDETLAFSVCLYAPFLYILQKTGSRNKVMYVHRDGDIRGKIDGNVASNDMGINRAHIKYAVALCRGGEDISWINYTSAALVLHILCIFVFLLKKRRSNRYESRTNDLPSVVT